MDRRFSTAKAFNKASEEAGWGYELRQHEGEWMLFDREGILKAWAQDEIQAALWASELVEALVASGGPVARR